MSDAHEAMRREWPMHEDWDFVRTGRRFRPPPPAPPDDALRVDLPHCWNGADTFQPGLAYYRGPGTYWKKFRVPDDVEPERDTFLSLVLEGFYGTGHAWLDNEHLARLDGEYLGTEIDLPVLEPGAEHSLRIRLTNRCSRSTLPGNPMPDFLLYGGLAGRVKLVQKRKLHFWAESLILLIAPDSETACRVSLGWSLRNRSNRERSVAVRWQVIDASGRTVGDSGAGSQARIAGRCSVDGQASFLVDPIVPWDVTNPVLYQLRGELLEGDRVIDRLERRIGFRTAVFSPSGFHLNGERLLLRGCNRHESMPGAGNALPLEQHREDAALLKEMGFNFVRLSHYPQHPAFLDACDELGILVFAEIASWKSVRGGAWLRHARRQLKRMIQRDRHHPSVILWGLGNEGRHRGAFLAMDALAHDLDPARATIYAENHLHRARRKRTLGLTDVYGVNYELDVLGEVGAHCRAGAILVSECSNEPHTERGDLEAEARQVERILCDLEVVTAHPNAAGYALWCFNDYATLRKDRYRRFSGVVDAWRVPKMAAAAHQALVASEPMLRVFADWPRTAGSGPGTVHLVSNCERIQWSCGHAQGELDVAGVYTRLQIDAPGDRMTFRGRKGGHIVEVETFPYGPASRLRMIAERDKAEVRRGESLSILVRVEDEEGRCVRGWSGLVRVASEGRARLLIPTATGEIWVHGGIGRLFVQGHGAGGSAKLRAECSDLEGDTLEIFDG